MPLRPQQTAKANGNILSIVFYVAVLLKVGYLPFTGLRDSRELPQPLIISIGNLMPRKYASGSNRVWNLQLLG